MAEPKASTSAAHPGVRRVGVRELRQDASRLLGRVAEGESIEITNHGRSVARLVPVDYVYPRTFEVLLAEGVIRAGRGAPWTALAEAAPAGTPSSSDLLDEERAGR